MYKVLYLKYRPSSFGDMIGQEHIRSVLKRQCQTGRVAHAYIFCGTRGTGKTTSARILAKAVNCLSPVDGEPCGKCEACLAIDSGSCTDVLELDAASNNKVDDIRSLCDELIYPPTSLKKRVYIIDEVHMLTSSAYNALLKTLEEPPAHVLFILATTELNKIPPTILSRCQRFEFRRIPAKDIASHLLDISSSEGIKLDNDAADLLSRLADGSVRDSISLLESCIEAADGGAITREVVASQLGIAEDRTIDKLFEAVSKRDVSTCLSLLDDYYASAKSLTVLLDDMLSAVRDMLFVKQGGKAENLMSNMAFEKVNALSALFTNEQLIYFASTAEEARNRLTGYAMNKRLVTELAVIRLCDARFSDSTESLAARIAKLERDVSGGVVTRQPIAAAAEPEQTAEKAAEKPIPVPDEPKNDEIAYETVSELCEMLSNRPDVSRLLQNAVMTVKGGDLIIYVSNDFTKSLLSSKNSLDAISDAARAVDGVNRRIIISSAKPKTASDDSSSDLINELG